MIKLIASDIDGTLVHDGTHELNPELCDVILQLKEKGIQFAAASGRQWASIEDLFDPISAEEVLPRRKKDARLWKKSRTLLLPLLP